MIVAGGTYREVCNAVRWNRIFGSGGRAAAAAARWQDGVSLVSYACRDWVKDATYSFSSFGLKVEFTEIDDDILFVYSHPLAPPALPNGFPKRHSSLRVKNKVVLRFGFLEGDAVVEADRAIYDPQGTGTAEPFTANGSICNELALVLNEGEALSMSGASSLDAALDALSRDGSVVIVKRGTAGVLVRHGTNAVEVPAFVSDRVMKIGSGDVFSGTFAHFWGQERYSPSDAAEAASRAVSYYVETRSIPDCSLQALQARSPAPSGKAPGRIYIAAPFFTTAELWLVEQIVGSINSLGATAFSPFHDVGFGGATTSLAQKDLRGLESCQAVIAVLDGGDPGTLFEIGHARARDIPVILLAENVRQSDFTMFTGTGCLVAPDLATAVYKAVWATMR